VYQPEQLLQKHIATCLQTLIAQCLNWWYIVGRKLTQTTKGEDLEPGFQVLPFCFQASFPDPDAAGLEASCGLERLVPDLFAMFAHRYIFIIHAGHGEIKYV